MRILAFITILGTATIAAGAEEKGAAREFLVEHGRGAFDVTLTPAFVTTFYFPEPVQSAIAADQKNFEIVKMSQSVVVQPVKAAKPGTKTNLNVTTEHMQVSLILTVGATENAVSQVTFVRAEERAKFDERVREEVERQVAERTAALDADRAKLAEVVDARVRTQTADRMLSRFSTKSLKAIERNDANVVIRVMRATVVGPDTYVWFEVQNRGARRWVLKMIEVASGTSTVTPFVRFEGASAGQPDIVGSVEGKDARATGIIVVPTSEVTGRALKLKFMGADGKDSIRIEGIRVD